jgi:IstB-like ATP binding protein
LVGRRVEVRVSDREILGVALDTGELACRHARSFAKHRTITALDHVRALRTGRQSAGAATVEVRPLARYIPFDPHAANLMFMLVSRRYERASLIVTSNKPFSAWGEIFGDENHRCRDDRSPRPPRRDPPLKGDSYRLKDRDLAGPPDN